MYHLGMSTSKVSQEDKEALAAVLREHEPPFGIDGLPKDEFDCCVEKIIQAGWRPIETQA